MVVLLLIIMIMKIIFVTDLSSIYEYTNKEISCKVVEKYITRVQDIHEN